MVSRRAYRRVSVNEIDREQLLELAKEHGNPGTVLGLDIARNEIVACLRWDQDHFERPWKIINPKEIGVLVELCELLKSHCTGFRIGLESTGTYGEDASALGKEIPQGRKDCGPRVVRPFDEGAQ